MPVTMSREEIIDKLCHLAAAQVGADPSRVTAHTDVVNDLNYDSLDVVEFIMTIEDQFEVSIPDEQADRVKTIGQAADLLTRILG